MYSGYLGKPAADYTDPQYWNGLIKMSLSRFFILSVLHQRPMHGYEIARQVEKATSGCCSPTEGTIYPVLREFARGGYVTVRAETVSGRGRKVYALTAKGRQAFAVGVKAWMEVSTFVQASRKMISRGL